MGYLDPGSGSLLVQLVFVIVITLAIVCGTSSALIMRSKGRSFGGGFALGFFLGVIGLIIVLLLQRNESGIEKQILANGRNKQCPYCLKVIDARATICPFCRSQL